MTLLLCVALTAFAVLVTGVQVRRRRPRSATRWLGAALLPVGAYLTGLLTLTARIVDAVVRWATSLVLSPVTWVGLGLLAAGLVLLVGAGLVRPRRGRGTAGGDGRADAQPGRGGPVRSGGRKAAKSSRSLPGKPPASAGAVPAADDDFAEVEEILRRRGL